MTRQAPWSVKGISPETREAAKGLARRDGVALGEWLSGLIAEVDSSQSGAQPARPQSEPNQYAQPVFDPSYASARPGLQPFPASAAGHPAASLSFQNEQSRLVEVLESLTRRLDPTAPAMTPVSASHGGPSHAALERALSELAGHVDQRDRLTSRTIGQMDAGLAELQQTQDALTERLRRIEQSNADSRSLGALRSLEQALAQLDREMRTIQAQMLDGASGGTQRIAALEEQVAGLAASQSAALQTVQTSVQGSVSALASASEHLADRVLDLETSSQKIDDQAIYARIGQMEEITTRALEETDRGIGLLQERIASAEALSQETRERFADAMVDLSARLAALEGTDLSGLEGKVAGVAAQVGQLGAQVNHLDSRITTEISTARDALREEVETALGTGIDRRFADLAGALSGRLEAAEAASTSAMEKIGAEVARIAETLDRRMEALESDEGRSGGALAMKLEVARISRAIDERLVQIEERTVNAPEQAGKQIEARIEALGQSLEARIGGIEARTRGSSETISEEMRALVKRLEDRQTEMAESLSRRIGETEERTERRIEERMRGIEREISAAEDRAKAVSAPLHRGFEALLDRIDTMETGDGRGMAEVVAPPDYTVGFASGPVDERPPAHARRGGFASPFPGDPFSSPGAEGVHNQPETVSTFDPRADLILASAGDADFDPLSLEAGLPDLDLDLGDSDQSVEVWPIDAPSQQVSSRGAPDFIANARRAAIEAAAVAPEAATKARKPVKRGKEKGAEARTLVEDASIQAKAPRKQAAAKSASAKPGLSPVGIAAAAGLVIAVGVAGYGALNRDAPSNEMPESLAPETPSKAAAPQMQAPAATAPAAALPPATVPDPVTGEPATPSTLEGAKPATDATGLTTPAAGTSNRDQTAATPARPRPGAVSPEMERLARQEQARAEAARARAQAGARTAAPPARGEAPRPARTDARTQAPRDASGAPTPRIASAATPRAARPAPPRGDAGALLTQARQLRQSGDAAAAAAAMRRAADAGSLAAQNELASMYERGEGVPRDLAQARRWTERAAAGGSRRAQHNLGVYYTEGEGAARDMNRARENFTAAARRGNTDSQYNLGAMAEQGIGRDTSQADAAFWYSVAGRGGDQEAARQAERVRGSLSAEEQAAVDARVAAFQPEAGGEE